MILLHVTIINSSRRVRAVRETVVGKNTGADRGNSERGEGENLILSDRDST